MRTGLIAALARTEEGTLRADLPLAGRSVLAWQVALLREFGAERIICLCEGTAGEVLRLQHEVESASAAFHALNGFAALPALVRAEDELVILRDGLVPDLALAREMLGGRAMKGGGAALQKAVACLPADHPLAATHPEDFERIDAARHWAGLLVMRGAPVQQLADFPADADAISVLLRLALQAGTPCRELGASELAPETWLLAISDQAVAAHEAALINAAVPAPDWRAPIASLAAVLVRRLAPRGLGQGALIAAATAALMLLGGIFAAASGGAAGGVALAAAGGFAARVSGAYAALAARLRRRADDSRTGAALGLTVDAFAALTLWFALAPWPDLTPLAVCGPIVIGLARLVSRDAETTLAAIASDRASLLLLLALAAWLGFLPETAALTALALLAALLLRRRAN
jgi:hypothetical protein